MSDLRFVVIHEAQPRIDAVVSRAGRPRRVTFTWQALNTGPMPAHWFDAVEGELDAQDAEEHQKASGRWMP